MRLKNISAERLCVKQAPACTCPRTQLSAAHLCDLPAFMISPYQKDAVWVADLRHVRGLLRLSLTQQALHAVYCDRGKSGQQQNSHLQGQQQQEGLHTVEPTVHEVTCTPGLHPSHLTELQSLAGSLQASAQAPNRMRFAVQTSHTLETGSGPACELLLRQARGGCGAPEPLAAWHRCSTAYVSLGRGQALTHEEVAGTRRVPAHPKQLHQVVKLAVNITAWRVRTVRAV